MADDNPPPGYYQASKPVVVDWGQVVSFTPDVYFTPTSLEELAGYLTAVIQAWPPGRSLRFLGGLHSCSGIFQSEIIFDLSQLPLEFEVTPQPDGGQQVVASAFMHAHDFLARAAEHDLSLTALGGTDAQTLAGLISTNTAGATVHTSVYETVDWVEYLTVSPDGRSLVTKRCAKTDPDFQAVICSIGTMGFLTRVAFTLVPQLYFVAKFEMRAVTDVLGDLAKTCAENDFWRIEWLPGDCRLGLFWSANPQQQGVRDPNGDYPVDGTESLLKWVMKEDEALLDNGPYANEAVILVYEAISLTYTPTSNTGPMRLMIPCDRVAPLAVGMAEWSFDPTDLPQVMDTCRAYFKQTHWPNLPIEIECTRTDSYLMSAWNWPGLPFIVKLNFQYLTNFLTDAQKAEMVSHLQGMWAAFEAAGIRFKAHWGKINFLDAASVAKRYQLAAFLPHVQPLFLNDYTRKRLLATPA